MYKQGNNLYYSVTGRGEFPIDMLRYDEANPASQADRAVIEAHADPYVDTSTEVLVNLVMPNVGHRLPNAERWGSFGWGVVEMSDAAESEAARRQRLQTAWDNLLLSLTPGQREAMDYFRPERVI